jgi:hypothetical protein
VPREEEYDSDRDVMVGYIRHPERTRLGSCCEIQPLIVTEFRAKDPPVHVAGGRYL